MKRHHLSRGRRLSHSIGEVDMEERSRGRPGFASIIVRKDTGLPGGGYFCDDGLPPELVRPGSRATDPRLSPAEVAFVRRQQARTWTYYGRSPK